MIRPRFVQTADTEVRRLQDALIESILQLQNNNPILNGVFVTTTIGTSDTAVEHGLGEEPSGWFLTGRDANAVVWESSTANASRKDKLILKASASVAVTVYVF